MGKKIVRLTESELIRLVKRVVKEQQMGGETMEGFLSDKFGWIKDAAKEVANLFKTEVMPEIPEDELEDMKDLAKKLNPKEAVSNVEDFASSKEGKEALEKAEEHISPDVLTEAIIREGLSDRVVKILARTGVISGIGLTISGFIQFASFCMGYIESSFLVKVHEIIDPLCGIFCGPLSVLVIILGASIALGSAAFGNRRSKEK
jgi:hypothetical protein